MFIQISRKAVEKGQENKYASWHDEPPRNKKLPKIFLVGNAIRWTGMCARTCTSAQRILYRAWIMYSVGADNIDQHLGGFDQYWYTLSTCALPPLSTLSLSLFRSIFLNLCVFCVCNVEHTYVSRPFTRSLSVQHAIHQRSLCILFLLSHFPLAI